MAADESRWGWLKFVLVGIMLLTIALATASISEWLLALASACVAVVNLSVGLSVRRDQLLATEVTGANRKMAARVRSSPSGNTAPVEDSTPAGSKTGPPRVWPAMIANEPASAWPLHVLTAIAGTAMSIVFATMSHWLLALVNLCATMVLLKAGLSLRRDGGKWRSR